MQGFTGSFTSIIDEKGRLSLPSKVRPADPSYTRGIPAGEILYVTKGLDGCLAVYPLEEWNRVRERLDKLPTTKADIRRYKRELNANSIQLQVDKSGRINIPANLRDLAGLDKEVLVIGMDKAIELWNPGKYKDYSENYPRSFEEVAESLFQESGDE